MNPLEDYNINPSFHSLQQLQKIVHSYLKDNISVVFELGARYCEDSVELAKLYPDAQVYSFECNEKTLASCRKVAEQNSRITLIEQAVCDYDGVATFYPIDETKTTTTWMDGNQGASSLYKASGKYTIENYVQREVQVKTCKLSTIMSKYTISRVDVMWMDIQGAELSALKGAQHRLKDISIIHAEVEFFEIYSNQPFFEDVRQFLTGNGFSFYGFTNKGDFAGDAVFINNKIINRSVRKKISWWCHIFKSVHLPVLKRGIKKIIGRR